MITENSVSSDEVVIQAPAELVWEVLVDFATYPEWNKFCPEILGKPEVGSPVRMQVDLGFGIQEQVEYVTEVVPGQSITWSMENKPGDPVHADRTQTVEPIDATSCRYVSVDVFSGEGMKPMLEAMGKAVETGFNLCAQCVKERAEALYAAR